MDNQITLTVEQACATTGYGRTKLYDLIGSGRVRAKKDGQKTLILSESLRNHINSLPDKPLRKAS